MNVNFKAQTEVDKAKIDRAVKNVLYKSMFKIQALAKRKAPVDTGKLQQNIPLIPDTPGQSEYKIVVAVNYGAYVEYGTIKQKAQPYLRPALNEVKRIWVSRYANQEFTK